MDIEELDRWLDADDEGGARAGGDQPAGERPGGDRLWSDATAPTPAGRGRRARPRWLVPVVVAGGVWLAVAAVLLVGGDDEAPQGSAVATASPDDAFDMELATEAMADPLPAADATGSETGDLPTPAALAGPEDPGQSDATAGEDGTAAGEPTSPPDDGLLHGAAVAGLRVELTGSAAGRERYLELATPVAVQPLADGVVLVLVDAVWLEGEGGALSEARQGRWAVPVADDGTVLGTPWPVPGPPSQVPAGDPPIGTLRLPEVGPAMAAAGWTDVVAAAADPHPFLQDVVVALVSGIAPGGAVRDGDVVWLQAQDDGLVLLGVPS